MYFLVFLEVSVHIWEEMHGYISLKLSKDQIVHLVLYFFEQPILEDLELISNQDL